MDPITSSIDRFVATEEAMLQLGEEIASDLADGSVVGLCGGLGAGKTHLTSGIARGLGYAGVVTSPTFTIVHEYPAGVLPLFHFDFYRLEGPSEVESIGWDDYLDRRGVVVVEWADRFPQLFPREARWITIESPDGGGRRVREGMGCR